jgi:hypothetical protein
MSLEEITMAGVPRVAQGLAYRRIGAIIVNTYELVPVKKSGRQAYL